MSAIDTDDTEEAFAKYTGATVPHDLVGHVVTVVDYEYDYDGRLFIETDYGQMLPPECVNPTELTLGGDYRVVEVDYAPLDGLPTVLTDFVEVDDQ